MSKKLYIKKDNHLLTLLDEEDIQDKLDEKLDIEDGPGIAKQHFRIITLTSNTPKTTTNTTNDTFVYTDDYGEIEDDDVFLLINQTEQKLGVDTPTLIKINDDSPCFLQVRGGDLSTSPTYNIGICVKFKSTYRIYPLKRHSSSGVFDTSSYPNLNISANSTQTEINLAINDKIGDIYNTIPSASSSTPSADVSGGAIGSSSNYAKADHQHPLSSAYATSGHNHSGTYAPVNHNQASTTITDMDVVQVVVTYTDNTTETLNLFKKVVSQ